MRIRKFKKLFSAFPLKIFLFTKNKSYFPISLFGFGGHSHWCSGLSRLLSGYSWLCSGDSEDQSGNEGLNPSWLHARQEPSMLSYLSSPHISVLMNILISVLYGKDTCQHPISAFSEIFKEFNVIFDSLKWWNYLPWQSTGCANQSSSTENHCLNFYQHILIYPFGRFLPLKW